MSPSYNDAFGSFSTGGTDAGGVSGAPVGVAPVINSGQKPKKNLKFILVVIGIFALVAVGVFALWKGGLFGGGNVKTSIKNYISLLVYGKESGDEISGDVSLSELMNSEDVKNIYSSLRLSDPIGEENVEYYSKLKKILEKIQQQAKANSDEKYLASLTLELLPRYFVSTILADTNASYNYFVENGNLDNFLAGYDYPFKESERAFLQDDDGLINALVSGKKELYGAIKQANCLASDGVDYECLDMLDDEKIKVLQLNNLELENAVRDVARDLLDRIIINANSMNSLIKEGENVQQNQ